LAKIQTEENGNIFSCTYFGLKLLRNNNLRLQLVDGTEKQDQEDNAFLGFG